jgi:hypothetical protein
MKLTAKAVADLKELYIKDTKVEISDEDARKKAEGLMGLFLPLDRKPYHAPKSRDNAEELGYALRWKKFFYGPGKPKCFKFEIDLRFWERLDELPTFLKPEFQDYRTEALLPLKIVVNMHGASLCECCRIAFEPTKTILPPRNRAKRSKIFRNFSQSHG